MCTSLQSMLYVSCLWLWWWSE